MSVNTRWGRSARWLATACIIMAAQAFTPAFAQDAPAPAPAESAPSDSAMVNLVRLLVDQGVLTADKGAALMRQAQAEADRARAAQQTALAAAAPGGLPAPAPGTIRVPYVPQTVRDQIKAELRTEVMQTARAEGWASPDGAAPDWTRRITLNGDVRVRSQSVLYSKTNSDQILDFARINAQGPFDVSGLTPFPYLNTRKDRINQLQLRARLGMTVKISDRVEAGFQIASGDTNSPISLNASLGDGLESLMERETRQIVELSRTADGLEGIRAFVEKRPPRFEG